MAEAWEVWQEEEKDAASGRKIFAREVVEGRKGDSGTYDFSMEREFQVRSERGEVLLQKSGSSNGEYWCGVFLFFVDGSDGRRVRLDESNKEKDEFFDVPDTPIPEERIWK